LPGRGRARRAEGAARRRSKSLTTEARNGHQRAVGRGRGASFTG
jgi:hypothetical protein